jgi:hypothetical protein
LNQTDFKKTFLGETREELARADAKASILLAASGITFAALFAVGKDSRWYPGGLTDGAARVSAWVAVGLTLLGIGFVAMAVKPRLRAQRPEPGAPHYFADVEAYWPRWWHVLGRKKAVEAGRRDFGLALKAMSQESDFSERLDDQIWALSHIAYRKYRFVSLGIWLYGLAAAAGVVAFLLEKKWV